MSWREHFDALGEHVERGAGGDRISLYLEAEDSDFVRFNGGRVRQPGSVHAGMLTLRLVRDGRQATRQITLTGALDEDRRRIDGELEALRAVVPLLPEDPHLCLPDGPVNTDDDDGGSLPDAWAATRAIVEAAEGLDLVGLYAGGANHRGYRDTTGQRNWFTSHSTIFDWCLVHSADKAVKQSLAGPSFDGDAFRAQLDVGRQDLQALSRPSHKLEPGSWRAFLTPAALDELLGLLAWDGFSARAQQRGQSPLQRLLTGERLHPSVRIRENLGSGLAPRFTADGFVRPEVVSLVEEGQHAGALIGPRTAAELGLTCNSGASESPVALEMAGGDLPMAGAREALGTGVWVSQLWYTNHSDRNAGRMTGMTRFATLWVEDGEVVGPVDVMRFDDTVYNLLGARLLALTTETVLLPSTSTYSFRSTSSARLPGALVEGITFTL